jgi:hypothetical protein
MDDRRSINSTKIGKDALLFFGAQTGVRPCAVTDITNVGAGIRAHDLPAIPPNFELSFDKFRASRNCRLTWRGTGNVVRSSGLPERQSSTLW